MSVSTMAVGLLGALNTTPWYVAVLFGLGLVVAAAVLFWLAAYFENSVKNTGCLSVLLGFLGIVFALTGFTALFIGFFGGA